MKKYLLMLVIAPGCYFISCNNKAESGSGLSPAAQKNLDAMHGVSNAFDTRDFSKIGDYIAVDAVDHSGEKGDIKGLDSLKAAFMKWTDGVEGQKTEIIKELADDDYAMSWNRYTGTYKTEGMGHKAGDKYDMKAIEVSKFKDGKATEHWTFMEPADMMKMMATMPQPPMAGDSTKKK